MLGRVKWFHEAKGHGFIITLAPPECAGREVFVHFSGIRPKMGGGGSSNSSNFRTLCMNEYVNFSLSQGRRGAQAVDVSGVMGGPLQCDSRIAFC